jgi:hypothetical protein
MNASPMTTEPPSIIDIRQAIDQDPSIAQELAFNPTAMPPTLPPTMELTLPPTKDPTMRERLQAILKYIDEKNQDSKPMGLQCSDQLTEPPTMEPTLPPTIRDIRLALPKDPSIAQELDFNPAAMQLSPAEGACLDIPTGEFVFDQSRFTLHFKIETIFNGIVADLQASGRSMADPATNALAVQILYKQVEEDLDHFFKIALLSKTLKGNEVALQQMTMAEVVDVEYIDKISKASDELRSIHQALCKSVSS